MAKFNEPQLSPSEAGSNSKGANRGASRWKQTTVLVDSTKHMGNIRKGKNKKQNCTASSKIQAAIFGDYLVEKKENEVRIGFQNFNRMSGKHNDPADASLKSWITENNFDVFGILEVNLFWPKVSRSLQFHDQISAWWQPGQHQSVVAYNRNEKRKLRSILHYGGTAQISRENASLRIQASGEDPRGLGR